MRSRVDIWNNTSKLTKLRLQCANTTSHNLCGHSTQHHTQPRTVECGDKAINKPQGKSGCRARLKIKIHRTQSLNISEVNLSQRDSEMVVYGMPRSE